MIKTILLWGIFTCLLFLNVKAQQNPRLEKRGNATQLIVDGKPFLVLGGEMYNSSSSNLDYMRPLWAQLRQKNLNTALVAVYWQLMEPQEGKFDFSLVDGILKGARDNNMHVILLWFGSWKNGLSHYVPDWVKKDTKKYQRIVLQNGHSTETISALSTTSMQADTKAFAALMHHIKLVDVTKRVLMVQVENEVGVGGDTRDHSAIANTEFEKPVPAALMDGLAKHKNELQPAFKKTREAAGSKTSGNWADVFGNGAAADEIFMAWQYATYMNTVAKAGKAEYNIPMYVNTWIVQPDDKKPGDYPSGGPQAHMHDIWRIGASAIDIKAPDIYLPDFKGVVALYYHTWNPLFVPESFSGEDGAANAFYAIGKYNGIGYSPFGIDRKENNAAKTPLAQAYRVLSQLSPEILAAQSAGKINAVILNKTDSVQTVEMNGYQLSFTLRHNWVGQALASKAYGLIINTGPDSFTIAGSNIDVTFLPTSPGPTTAGLASVTEGTYVNGKWKAGRVLNGDDVMIDYHLAEDAARNQTGTAVKIEEQVAILKVKLYRF